MAGLLDSYTKNKSAEDKKEIERMQNLKKTEN